MSDAAERSPGGPLDRSAGAPDPVAETERWIEEFVLGLDLCPFAAGPWAREAVRVRAVRVDSVEAAVAELLHEATVLAEDGAETSLLVLAGPLAAGFDAFLDLLALAEEVFDTQGPGATIQLVGFHPQYVFGDAPIDDPAHATNRSPHPTIHLLRRADVARAVAGHPDIAGIPRRNQALLRALAAR